MHKVDAPSLSIHIHFFQFTQPSLHTMDQQPVCIQLHAQRHPCRVMGLTRAIWTPSKRVGHVLRVGRQRRLPCCMRAPTPNQKLFSRVKLFSTTSESGLHGWGLYHSQGLNLWQSTENTYFLVKKNKQRDKYSTKEDPPKEIKKETRISNFTLSFTLTVHY